ncbi:hypothetical protein ACTFIV_002710 [Dictyostelium citrinum]
MVKMDFTLKTRIKQTIKRITFEDIKVHLVLLSVCLVFSVFYIVAKLAMDSVPPFVFLMLRLVIATPLLWLMAIILSPDTVFKLPSKKEFILLSISGIFSVTINQSLFLYGLYLSGATNAAIVQPLTPVFSAIFAVLLKFERKTKLKFIGVAIAVIGAVLMVDFTHLKSNDSSTKNILFGNLCFLGNTLAYAIFLLSQKPLIDDGGMSASKCMAWSFTIGTPPVIGIALIIAKSEVSSQVASISLFSWLAIIYCAIFATAYAFFASSWAVAKSDSTTVSVYLTVEPLLTGVLAYIFLKDELLTPLNIVGGIVILVGVGAVMVSKYREGKKDTLYKYEKQKLNAEKQYNINNGSIELPQFIDSTFDNNNKNINNINNTSNGDIISNSISHSSSENSFSKIIVSTSIISQPDDNNNNNKNNNNFINNDNNNSNNTINNIINIRNSYDDNLDNSKNNLLSIFKKQTIISDDDDDDDNNGGKDEYDLDISKSGEDSLRAGAVLVF